MTITLGDLLAALNPLDQVRRERHHIRNKQAGLCLSLAVAAAAAPWVRREDGVDADEVWILGPIVRVRAEVADKDEDLEGAAESKPRLVD